MSERSFRSQSYRKRSRRCGQPRSRFTPLQTEHLEARTMLSLTPQFLFDLNDITAGVAIGSPIVEMNGVAFFAGSWADGKEYQLWRSDGTVQGTDLVKDVRVPTSGIYFDPGHLANVNGTLFFSGRDSAGGAELWKSDGTPAGTRLVKDIAPGGNNAYPQSLTNVNGTLFFDAWDGVSRSLWKSDGTEAGTI